MAFNGPLFKTLRSVCGIPQKLLYATQIRSTARLTLPDFLGIGAQKAGTTWLYKNLRCHPELYLPEKKELHYFDAKFHRSLRWYSDHFRLGAHQVKGEITPAYSILPPRRIRFVRDVMPSVRLIFLMRNPVERAWSHAVMELATQRNRRIEEVPESEFYAHFRAAPSVERSNYLNILANWLAVFPREQLLIGFFEHIANRPRDVLREVFNHLGVLQSIDWDRFPYDQRIRPHEDHAVIASGRSSDQMPQGFMGFLHQMYCKQIDALHKRFGHPISGWR